MGIYDRDYYRQERPSASSYIPRTVVGAIIAVNVAVWIADFLTPATSGGGTWLSDHLAVHVYTLTKPWLWWEYLTAGFTHSPHNFGHILFNMFGLFIFGREVERAYGSREFLRVYLAMVVFASVVWNVINWVGGPPASLETTYGAVAARQFWEQNVLAYGASGAIAGVIVLYAMTFPHNTILLFFAIPVPAWLCGVLMVCMDMLGATGGGGQSNVAYSMHLAGAAFAFVYHQRGWNLTRLTEGHFSWPTFRRKPRLRVLVPDEEPREAPLSSNLSAEVDRILAKIYSQGEAALTAAERKTLETASREYQRKAKTNGGSHRDR